MSAVLETQIQIRPMENEDLDSIQLIEEATYEFPWSQGIFRDCLHVGYSCWVYLIDDEIASYAVMSVGGGEAHILTLVVAAPHRQQGIGSQMMRHLMDKAFSYKVDTLLLEVRPSNHVAIRLYSRMGFNEVGVRRDYYPAVGGREDALVMAMTYPDNVSNVPRIN